MRGARKTARPLRARSVRNQSVKEVNRPVGVPGIPRIVRDHADGRSHATVGQRELDVLVHRQVADQVEALKDEPDLSIYRKFKNSFLVRSGPIGQAR